MQGREGEDLLDDAHERGAKAELHPHLDDKGQGLGFNEEQDDPENIVESSVAITLPLPSPSRRAW